MCALTEFNGLVKTHVCFHQAPPQASLRDTRVPKLSPSLTLATPAAITLPAPLLVHHRVAPTLWAKIASYTQVAQAQWACKRSGGGCYIGGTIHSVLPIGGRRRISLLLLSLWLL